MRWIYLNKINGQKLKSVYMVQSLYDLERLN